MHRRMIAAGFIVCAWTAPTAAAEDPLQHATAAFEALLSAKSLKCSFGSGTHATWNAGRVSLEKASLEAPIHFDAIDPRAGKARIIGNIGASDIAVLVSPVGITFVEQPLVSMNFTTVFSDQAPSSREFLAVTSRHFVGLGGEVAPSQYHGRCKVWE